MPKVVISNDKLTAIGDAIRTEAKHNRKMTLDEMNSSLTLFADTSTGTISSKEIVSGYSAYSQDQKISGSITNYDGSYENGITNISNVEQSTPRISMSTGGVITATNTQQGGIVAAGTKTATYQMTSYGKQTLTPGTTNKTLKKERFVSWDITIKGDSNLIRDNIMYWTTLFNIEWNFTKDATATEEDVTLGKTFYSKWKLLTGTREDFVKSSTESAYYGESITISDWKKSMGCQITGKHEDGLGTIVLVVYSLTWSSDTIRLTNLIWWSVSTIFVYNNQISIADDVGMTTPSYTHKEYSTGIKSILIVPFFGSSSDDWIEVAYWRY